MSYLPQYFKLFTEPQLAELRAKYNQLDDPDKRGIVDVHLEGVMKEAQERKEGHERNFSTFVAREANALGKERARQPVPAGVALPAYSPVSKEHVELLQQRAEQQGIAIDDYRSESPTEELIMMGVALVRQQEREQDRIWAEQQLEVEGKLLDNLLDADHFDRGELTHEFDNER